MSKRLVAIDNRIGVTSVASVAMEWVELEAARLAALVRASFIAGPLAALEAQNRHGREMAQQADLDATQDAAAGRWGY